MNYEITIMFLIIILILEIVIFGQMLIINDKDKEIKKLKNKIKRMKWKIN